MPDVTIRPAVRGDVAEILDLIRDLAAYEREPDAVRATEQGLARHLFADHPVVFATVAEAALGGARVEQRLAGVAVWFINYSTWEGTPGLYLEDLYVRPEARGAGVGRALMTALATECVARGYPRLEWSVLKWNTPSIAFYEAFGATAQTDWQTYRLSGEALRRAGGLREVPE